jgi:hypothetical protein
VIDEGLPDIWLAAVVEAAKKFQQGDLIETPPFAYAASFEHSIWDVTERARNEGATGVDHLVVDDLFPYGIITSQTCDVAEDRPDPVHPWFQISPVYECLTTARVLNTEYGYGLKAFPAVNGKRWVADLRLECSLEKGLLVGREPIDPFNGNEQERIRFGEEVGKRRARAALADSIHEFIGKTLHEHRDGNGRADRSAVKSSLYGLRLEIARGERLDPREVKLHVITVGEPSEVTVQWFGAWWSEAERAAGEHGVALQPNEFHDCTKADLRRIDGLIEVRPPFR